MAIELITGYAGAGHVSSADAGRFNAGVCGTGKYVLGTGTKFAYTVQSSNLIKIGSGDAVDQGRHIIIPQNSVEDAAIQNGNQNKTRIDVIALRYSKDAGTGVESASLVVIKGTEVVSGSTPTAPAVTSGNIFNGATQDDLPLYHVLINGTNIESVTKVFKEIPSLATVADLIYPVGSIYMNVTNLNPATVFGGTWEEIQGKFLLGRSASHQVGTSGGNETVTLTIDQMPAHTHTGPSHTHSTPNHTHTATCASAGAHAHAVDRTKKAASGTARYAAQATGSHNTASAGAHTHTITVASGGGSTTGAAGTGNTGSAGSGQAVNIMPPFLSVYMWKRTA